MKARPLYPSAGTVCEVDVRPEDCLSTANRRLLELRDRGLTHGQIGAILRISSYAVQKRIARAEQDLAEIRAELRRLDDE